MFAQGVVVDPSSGGVADGLTANINLGRSNELIVSELHGKYFEQAYRGNIYYASTTAAGVVIPISTTLTPTYSLWNPAGSGKLMVPIALLVGWDATTSVMGGLVWTATTNAGSGISSTAPFVAFGTGTAVNANLGSGKVSQMRTGTGGTTTLVAAPIFYRTTGIVTAATAAVTVTAGWIWRDDFDGTSVVPPGNAIHLMGSTAVAVTACITTVYAEIPL
jgi:hypothetical protein